MSLAEISAPPLLDRVVEIVGAQYVLDDEASCIFYAQDVHHKQLPAAAVVRPAGPAELAALVKVCAEAGLAVIPRGGGMSYTQGYVPAEANSVIVDLARLNRVLEINREDRYVTVECGCTWAELHRALEGTGLRTPYWGTLSGIRATIGGGLSQNSIFWGSGQFGTAVDSVLSLEVVLADGSIVETGAAAQQYGSPFFRHYGPEKG